MPAVDDKVLVEPSLQRAGEILQRLGGVLGKRLAVVGNSDCAAPADFTLTLGSQRKSVTDLLSRKRLKLTRGSLHARLGPGACFIFEY